MQHSFLTHKLSNSILFTLLILLTLSCKKTEKAIPTLSFEASISMEEGTANQQFVTITVKLSNDYDDLVKLYYQTTDGTAKETEDFVGFPETEVIFNAGETSKEIKIALVNDDIFEENESFMFVVNKVTNGKLALSMCNIIIINDDSFTPEVILPDRVRINEGTSSTMIPLTIRLSGPTTVPVTIKWSTLEGTAKAGSDFTQSSDNTLTFNAGVTSQQIQVQALGDNIMELDEGFYIHFSDVQNATFVPKDIIIILNNDDNFSLTSLEDGPISPDVYEGFELAWSDEFDGTTINSTNWGYDLGAGGWGNQELQSYTSSPTNSFVADGKLNIVATKLYASYNSARLLSKNKKDFTYGRIDIRAKMPIGKGIWPALWMLGSNISQVSWPRCGEIDIMEYLGHIPKQVHGTVHYNDGGHRYIGGQYTLGGTEGFNAKFHVFTILWSEYGIRWYVDYQPFYSIDDTDVKFESFKLPQFFIMNVAVGGVWPGYPDETTVFPQTMQVDYVRVFQQPN